MENRIWAVRAFINEEFDEGFWNELIEKAASERMNAILFCPNNFICYKSHPEIAAPTAFPREWFTEQVRKCRDRGIELLPEINFSATHDDWMGEYSRMVSTPTYYKVTKDLIEELYEVFESPTYIHLGMDEEDFGNQKTYDYCVIRKDDIWWHDMLHMCKICNNVGARPWIWSDIYWTHPEEFKKRMPLDVVQSNWYYGRDFDVEKMKKAGYERRAAYVKAYEDLDKAGFDQVPTGSNWSCDENFSGTVNYCRKVCSPERLKGFMMAPWFFTLPEWEGKNLEAIDQVGASIKAV